MNTANSIPIDYQIKLASGSREHPLFHIKEIQGIETLESFQIEKIIEKVARHRRVSIRAPHDVGKSFCMAKIVLWFCSTFRGAKVVTTAPTFTQVRHILWSEIRAGWERSKVPLGGKMNLTEWQITADWFAMGITAKAEAGGKGQGQGTASGFQGFHAPYVLVVFDEATGVHNSIWIQVEGLLTSHNVKFVCIGNPTSKASRFFKTFGAPAWENVHISCFDSPNLRANGIVDLISLGCEVDFLRGLSREGRNQRIESYAVPRPHLLTTQWVMEKALEWTIPHPLFQSKALGEFPEEDEHSLVSLGQVEEAQRREPRPGDQISIGVDVARFGSDKTIITVMEGLSVTQLKKLIKKRNTEISGEVIAITNALMHARKTRDVAIVVDTTGVGAGVADDLVQYKESNPEWRDVEIREVQFGERFKSPRDGSEIEVREMAKKYVNKKARAFLLLAYDIKNKLTLPAEEAYQVQLPAIIYRFDSEGRYFIEGKDDFQKRTGLSSPDEADSLALANLGRYDRVNSLDWTPEKTESDESSGTIAPSLDGGTSW